MSHNHPEGDVVDQIADPANPQIARDIRQHRPKIVAFIQATFDALFVDEPGNFGLRLRFSCAAKVAALTEEAGLAHFYLDALESIGPLKKDAKAQAVENAAFEHTMRVTTAPASCDQAALDALHAVGMTEYEIVTLSQLIGYVSFQARLILTVRALAGVERAAATTKSNPANFARHSGFTAEPIEWVSWLMPVDLATATRDQLAVLDESGPTARTSPYYLTLVHNPAVLRQRSGTYNAIMYAPGGLSRADRELGALVVSTLNGCPYCASVHAQRLNQLTKESDLVTRVFADPLNGGANERERELLRYARRLTLESGGFDVDDVTRLRSLGMSNGEILDYSHAVAIFAWANRLMQTLGAPILPDQRDGGEAGAGHA
ncbi:peroxidase-related enzyme [Paraburkholderia sp.]|uniref:CMD domain-containing protein n=1 Tax=Paraburkholderia sp. TaxID=1926495 RepID=UPI0026240336|nr:peroxidase-related enzyme [Paraburkholderia sp.]